MYGLLMLRILLSCIYPTGVSAHINEHSMNWCIRASRNGARNGVLEVRLICFFFVARLVFGKLRLLCCYAFLVLGTSLFDMRSN